MTEPWSDFYVASAGGAAALTGLLFIAVSLRPREIRQTRHMAGRARSAFYSFTTIAFAALLALAGTRSRLIGLAQFGVAIGAIAFSAPFTIASKRTGTLSYPRAALYHAGLFIVAAGGAVRVFDRGSADYSAVLAVGVLLLLGLALSNSWQLVISYEADEGGQRPSPS
jgi:hypothetical protein